MPQPRTAFYLCLFSIGLSFALTTSPALDQVVQAGDWPQILGPHRDGKAVEEAITLWTDQPPLRWRTPCGAGYAGVAVARGNVFLWHREGDEEILDCLSSLDGKRLWRASLPAVYRGGVDPDLGPRSVPLVLAEQVVVYGAAGDLSAISIADGQVRWSRQMRTDYDAEDGYFGAGSSPLAVGTSIIVAVGGRNQAGLVAVSADDGTTRWTAVDEEASYASPIRIQLAGRDLVAAVLRLRTVVIDPENGDVLSEFAFGKRGPTVNAATPLIQDDIVAVRFRPPRANCWRSISASIAFQSVNSVRERRDSHSRHAYRCQIGSSAESFGIGLALHSLGCHFDAVNDRN